MHNTQVRLLHLGLSILTVLLGQYLAGCESDDASQSMPPGTTTVNPRDASPETSPEVPRARDHRLAAGGAHTCAITSVGTTDRVVCWGSNEAGQLGTTERAPGDCTPLSGTPVAISAGRAHNCALFRDGRGPEVRCWGANNRGQLGDGTTGNSATPLAISGLLDPVEIVAGSDHNCARSSFGSVSCWGANGQGQLGNGAAADSARFVSVAGLANAVEVAAGDQHTCARLASGAVHCWGSNSRGQLGDGTTADRPAPVVVLGITDAVELTAGDQHTCARLASGAVRCWGSNSRGQLGDGTTTDRPAPVAVPGLSDTAELAAGDQHTCARGRDRLVRCWGRNTDGQLGDNTTTDRGAPVVVPDLLAFELSAGSAHSCAVLDRGRVQCWGSNRNAEAGTFARFVDARVNRPAYSLCTTGCAPSHPREPTICSLRCVNTQSDALHCGGCGITCLHGQECRGGACLAATLCPAGRTPCSGACVDTQTDAAHCGRCDLRCESGRSCLAGVCARSGATTLAAGWEHTCAVVAGRVRCWGSNAKGQLGDGSLIPGAACVGPALTDVVEVAAGGEHTCARLASGAVYCWGANGDGQLGDGTTTDRATPVLVPRLSAMQIVAGNRHTCARVNYGLRCWGANSFGQLGNNTTTSSATPVRADRGTTESWNDLAAGSEHTCGIDWYGQVHCWGSNAFGQVGVGGGPGERLAPVVLSGLRDTEELAAGFHHTCARWRGGEVRCWGQGGSGQLGEPATFGEVSWTPARPARFSSAVEIAAGRSETCARTADGTVSCWGGNGDWRASRVQGLVGAVELTVGDRHACARLSSGAVLCWGDNRFGQLGVGAVSSRARAEPVSCFAGCEAGTSPCAAGCVDLQSDALNCGRCGLGCAAGQRCMAGSCVSARALCPAGQSDCTPDAPEPTCVDLLSSSANCGGCGRACPVAAACVRGTCGCAMASQTLCGEGPAATCTDTRFDPRNCGRCGLPCPEGQDCFLDRCRTPARCSSGETDCAPMAPAPTCVNTDRDPMHCGACGVACTSGPCLRGRCLEVCTAPSMMCGGLCTNTLTDPRNCGRCGNACAVPVGGAAACAMGVCGASCPTGQTNCAGTCRPTGGACTSAGSGGCQQSGTLVCMGSATACSASPRTSGACAEPVGGTCNTTGTCACPPDRRACGGVCVDTHTDARHCGACAVACPSGQVCAAGACVATCAAPRTVCGTGATMRCTDTATDRAHCGGCGRACASGQDCVNGVCVGSGTLRFTLTWDTPGDMDLHVVPPCGTEVYYSSLTACGGQLDVDDMSRLGPENVFWAAAAPAGRYLVCPAAFNSSVANANYTLVVVRDGVEVRRFTGRRMRTDSSARCTASYPGVISLDL